MTHQDGPGAHVVRRDEELAKGRSAKDWRARIREALKSHPKGLSESALDRLAGCRGPTLAYALLRMLADGEVRFERREEWRTNPLAPKMVWFLSEEKPEGYGVRGRGEEQPSLKVEKQSTGGYYDDY